MTRLIINKDLDLKLMCKILFEKMGFCTQYEIQLRAKSYINAYKTHDVSDIDVYAYKFNADLSFFSLGSECKSGESGALEELFKFFGVVDYYGLDRGYLIKTKIHQNARQVASKNKVRCLTEAEIRQILLGSEVDVDKQIKIENAKYQKMRDGLKTFRGKNEKLIEYITLDYWNRENWRNIHNMLHLLPGNLELFADSAITTKDKLVYYFVLELFVISILKNIGDSIALNYSDIQSSVTNSLYGGAESLNERRRIHDLVNQATQSDAAFEAPWQGDLLHISSRLARSTYAASKIPSLIQELMNNSFYDNGLKITVKQLETFPDLTRKFTQDCMQFLTTNCQLDKRIFEDFMKI